MRCSGTSRKRTFLMETLRSQCTSMFSPTISLIVSRHIDHPPYRLPPFMLTLILCTPVGHCSLHTTFGFTNSMPPVILWLVFTHVISRVRVATISGMNRFDLPFDTTPCLPPKEPLCINMSCHSSLCPNINTGAILLTLGSPPKISF